MYKLFKKAIKRNLISEEENSKLRLLFEKYFRLINAYIKSIGQINENNQVQENEVRYEFKKPAKA